MSRRLKVMIVEPSAIITTGLEHILNDSGNCEVVCHLTDMENVGVRVEQLRPDLLIVNPTLPVGGKQGSVRSLMPEGQSPTLVALVYQYAEPAALRSYNGVLDIRESIARVADVLLELHASTEQNTQPQDPDSYELSERERAVLVLVAKGMMSKEIAEKLNISVHTVISHRKNITRKTGIKSVAGLAVYAMLHNLMDPE